MGNEQCQNLELLTRKVISQYASGHYEEWFSALYKDCIFIASGEPQLFGASNIIEHFNKHSSSVPLQIISETETAIPLGANTFIVTGQFIIGNSLSTPSATVLFTMAYRFVGEVPKIAYQHMSYDFIRTSRREQSFKQPSVAASDYLLDATSRLYIREILIGRNISKSIQIKAGSNTYYINPATILYLQSNDHHTTIYCVDNVIDSSMSISQLAVLLPDKFYMIRRGCIINTIFITAIRRCEVELVFNTVFTIPVLKFTTVKKELEALMKEN